MKDRNGLLFAIVAVFILLLFGGGYVYLLKVRPPHMPRQVRSVKAENVQSAETVEETMTIKLYFPARPGLKMEQREIPRVFSQKKTLRAAMEEFIRGPRTAEENPVPRDTVLLGVFMGSDGVAYVNFSEDFRRNFHGDVLDEFLLLRAVYESVISNIQVDDVKILVDGKETDSIGGHFFAIHPLKQLVTQEIRFD